MSHLVLIHVPADDHVATRVYHALLGTDVNVWVDHLHTTGSNVEHDQQAVTALRSSDGGLFILSRASVNDTECLTSLQALSDLNKRIVVLIWENLLAEDVPDWLNAYPWFDISTNFDHGVLEVLWLLKGKPVYEQAQTATRLKLVHLSGDFPQWHLDLPIIGRDSDVEAIKESLSGGHRGTLILGFAGVGKSRLAAEIASTVKFKDGVVWYTLTQNSTLGDLAALIIEHLGLDPRTEEHDLWPALRKYQMLLVLDGAEDCPQPRLFAEQLNRLHLNRGTQLLITSRQMWQDLREMRIHELRVPTVTVATEVLKRMARAEPPLNPITGYEAQIAKAAYCRPKLLSYALKWASFYEVDYILELLDTFQGADAKQAFEDLVNKTLTIARRHDDWNEVHNALRKLAIFRRNFPFDAARTILGEPRPLSLLKTWGMVSSQNGRWEIDPLLLRVIEPDSSTQQIQYQFYRAMVADLATKQDYTRLIAELDNIESAFNHAMSINDLAGAFEIAQHCSPFMSTWARFEQRKAWLDRIASCLQENTRDPLYADVQIALGVAYQERPGTDRRLNLQRSVTCFERALRRYTAARSPHHYALIQNDLGITYRILAETDHAAENLHLSIHAFNQAAKHVGPKQSPLHFAAVQNNMGAAYIQLAGVKDRTDNLWRAVAALRRAAPYLTPNEHPMQYAEVMHNLGTAFGELAEVSDRKDNLERAIRHYGRALQIFTPQTAPMDYARTYYNLGLAYRGYAELERPDQHLENAIRAFDQALRFWSSKTAPQACAAANMMLGQTWLDYAEIEYQQSHLEKAAESFREALEFYSIRNNPGEYVKALIMLGIVLRRMGKSAEALACWQKAEKYFRAIGMSDVADQMKGWLEAPPRHTTLFGREHDRPTAK